MDSQVFILSCLKTFTYDAYDLSYISIKYEKSNKKIKNKNKIQTYNVNFQVIILVKWP